MGDLVVIDVLDAAAAGDRPAAQGTVAAAKALPVRPASGAPPPAAAPAATPASPQPATPPPGQAAAAPPPPPSAPAPETPPAPPRAETANAQPEPVQAPSPPQLPPAEPAAASPTAPPATGADVGAQPASATDDGLVVPGDPQLGVAAFRRGNAALIVFDERRVIDTSALRDDPVFGAATVQTLPAATVIRVPLEAGTALSLSRAAGSWRITSVPREPALRPIQAMVAEDRLLLQAATPGGVVSVADPDTGATLLVGTQRRDGQGVPTERHAPEFVVLPTWQGVAVEANADTVALRPTPQGFTIVGAPNLSPAPSAANQLAPAVGLTMQFDFPDQPLGARQARMRQQAAEAAAAAPLARGPRRQALARTMIALGLGAEAGGMLYMAAADDPREAGSSDHAALAGIAALLAHRTGEADGLIDPRLPKTDDIALWRAMRLAERQEGSPEAAAVFAATLPLLLAYPPEMRDQLVPLVAETMVSGGELTAAAGLLEARKDDVALDLARAMLQQVQGNNEAALAGYDRLTQSRDQKVHARAAASAVELRLANGALDVKQAADRLESLLYAWRGDHRERTLRERLAELKQRSGAWRSALALLRDTETLFPDDQPAIHAELTAMFAALLRDDTADSLPPLELVSVVEENADLLPAGAEGDALQAKLADRLAALDLPQRAGPVLEKLMRAANSGVARAGFGARLATLRLREGDAAGALAALDASVAADLPADLTERRTLLAAAADARRGNNERALATLGALDSAAADEARATILERANDWPGAQRALAALATRTVPPDGGLDDGQRRTLLRLATATARAGDDAALTELRQREGGRMATGPLADMFRLLTADQVRGVADLKRSGAGGGSGARVARAVEGLAGARTADPIKSARLASRKPLACGPPYPHLPRPWP